MYKCSQTPRYVVKDLMKILWEEENEWMKIIYFVYGMFFS